MEENASTALYQAEYRQRYGGLLARYETARDRLAANGEARIERTAKRTNITCFLESLVKHGDMVTELDAELWYITADSVTVYEDRWRVVKFCDGSEVSIPTEAWKAAQTNDSPQVSRSWGPAGFL